MVLLSNKGGLYSIMWHFYSGEGIKELWWFYKTLQKRESECLCVNTVSALEREEWSSWYLHKVQYVCLCVRV